MNEIEIEKSATGAISSGLSWTDLHPMPEQRKSAESRAKHPVVANSDSPRANNQLEKAKDGTSLSENKEKDNYATPTENDKKLISQARKDLEELDKMTPQTEKHRRQELDDWTKKLDGFERRERDPALEKWQGSIDQLHKELQDLDKSIPLTATDDRHKLTENEKQVASMQKDINEVRQNQLRALASTIGHEKEFQRLSSKPAPDTPISSSHYFPVPILIKVNGLWINLASPTNPLDLSAH